MMLSVESKASGMTKFGVRDLLNFKLIDKRWEKSVVPSPPPSFSRHLLFF